MKNSAYPPEGGLYGEQSVKDFCRSVSSLEKAKENGVILEGKAFRCSEEHDLYVRLKSGIVGVIPFEECTSRTVRESAREIAAISRVGKYVCFKVTDTCGSIPVFSRRAAQEECMENCVSRFESGDVIDAVVTHMEPFGAFCDVGCGIISLLPIDSMSVSRISHPRDRFCASQRIKAVIRTPCDENGRVTLTHKELLGTWEENAARFTPCQAVTGKVRSIEKYGIFVELAPNLAGLAEYAEGYEVGDTVSVYIKSVIPQKMKVKLIIIDKAESEKPDFAYKYVIPSEKLERWVYSPRDSFKTVETVFQNTNSNWMP